MLANWKYSEDPVQRHREIFMECPMNTIMRKEAHSSNGEVKRARTKTFGKWWPFRKNDPKVPMACKIAEAGFIYFPSIEKIDRIFCISCNLLVNAKDCGGDPTTYHKKKSPLCPFILELEGSQKASLNSIIVYPSSPARRSINNKATDDSISSDLSSPSLSSESEISSVNIKEENQSLNSTKKRKLSKSSNSSIFHSSTMSVNKSHLQELKKSSKIERIYEMISIISDIGNSLKLELDFPSKPGKKSDTSLLKLRSENISLKAELEQINEKETPIDSIDNTTTALKKQLESGKANEVLLENALRTTNVLLQKCEKLNESFLSEKQMLEFELQKSKNFIKEQNNQCEKLRTLLKNAKDEASAWKEAWEKQQSDINCNVVHPEKQILTKHLYILKLNLPDRRTWFESELYLFEQRVCFQSSSNGKFYISSSTPFMTCADIPWPISPTIPSTATITSAMIISFLLSDLVNDELSAYSLKICGKYSSGNLKKWIGRVIPEERDMVELRCKDVLTCMMSLF